MTKDELSLLLFFETQAVDYGGTVASIRMNADDFAIAIKWNKTGFIKFGRIQHKAIAKPTDGIRRDHWCELSEAAWIAAHQERRARCARMMKNRPIARTCDKAAA